MDIKVDKYTVIVFDLDDTLYNEINFLKSAYLEIAQKLAKDNYKSLYARMISLYRNKHNVFEFLSENYPIELTQLIDLYRTHKPNIILFEGVLEFMKSIKEKNGKICLITDGRERSQMAKIKSLGIEDYLDEIIISEVIGSEKPSEANYKAIEDSFPECEYCYIADNLKKDFITPNKRGWSTIGLVDNGLNIHFEAHKYIDSEYSPEEFIISYNDINVI